MLVIGRGQAGNVSLRRSCLAIGGYEFGADLVAGNFVRGRLSGADYILSLDIPIPCTQAQAR